MEASLLVVAMVWPQRWSLSSVRRGRKPVDSICLKTGQRPPLEVAEGTVRGFILYEQVRARLQEDGVTWLNLAMLTAFDCPVSESLCPWLGKSDPF